MHHARKRKIDEGTPKKGPSTYEIRATKLKPCWHHVWLWQHQYHWLTTKGKSNTEKNTMDKFGIDKPVCRSEKQPIFANPEAAQQTGV